ncbi:glycosyltransferase [Pedobacter sandarakinus]|uniref:glycosyltransferase n=1 Tax=Pedobacter sandarakinus TaxID=353156 RepID=UPI002247643E|nr:glycosyltransferase [Pedobacter sandarakinus]MCX2574881.1 glycosyltransferase [Pedobacter sandarakinus]
MNKSRLHLNNTSLIITHYNRSESLRGLLQRLATLEITFAEILVSDDCSDAHHLKQLKQLSQQFGFRLFTTPVNKGLGASLNVLHTNARSDYFFYVQEDFVPGIALADALKKGSTLLEKEHWDIIRFYAFPWAQFPYQRKYRDGFNKLLFSISPYYASHLKFFVYSDHPHLKRKTFTDKFGPYKENVKGDETENAMCRSFLKHDGKALLFAENQSLFDHENTEEEPAQARSTGQGIARLRNTKPIYWLYLRFRVFRETFSYLTNT